MKSLLAAFFILIISFGCSILPFGNSNPSARNPGSTSTTTDLQYFSDAYAEEEEEGFTVADLEGNLQGLTKCWFKEEELSWVLLKKMCFTPTTTLKGL